MFLSLQGSMAVGKTTALRYIEDVAPYIHPNYEDNQQVIAEIRRRNLDANRFEDYLVIQRLWLQNERKRWEQSKDYPCTLMDFGAEEIEFYTLHYPKVMGKDWDVAGALKDELEAIQQCMPKRILFLDASEEILRSRKQEDSSRTRRFFEQYVQELLPLKRKWFLKSENVDVLQVDHLTREEVGAAVKQWCDSWLVQEKI